MFSLGVSKHMHRIKNLRLWKLDSIGHRNCKRKLKRITPMLHKIISVLSIPPKWRQVFRYLKVRNYLFLKNYAILEGAVSHNVLYYQQLSIVHNQVSFFVLTISMSTYHLSYNGTQYTTIIRKLNVILPAGSKKSVATTNYP